MRTGAWLLLFATAVGGCAALAGLDEDYEVGGTATGTAETGTGTATGSGAGTAAGTGAATGTATGGEGGSTGTGQAGAGGGGTGTPTGTGGVGGTGGTGGSGAGVVQCSGTHTYGARVADCINLNGPNPDQCATYISSGIMVISTAEYSSGAPHRAYLIFDLEPNVAQSTLSDVELRVTVSGIDYADSSNSGEIWRLQPFVRSDLWSGPPNTVGGSAIGSSQGAVSLDETVIWPLPTDVVDGGSVYLEMRPLTSNNTYYLNNTTSPAPQLVVTCQ